MGARCARASVVAMATDPDPRLRALGVRSLEDTPQLLFAVRDTAPEVRRAAIRAQSALQTPDAFVAVWSEIARSDPEPSVRVAALRAMGRGRVGLEAATRGLEDPQEQVRVAAAEARGRSAEPPRASHRRRRRQPSAGRHL